MFDLYVSDEYAEVSANQSVYEEELAYERHLVNMCDMMAGSI